MLNSFTAIGDNKTLANSVDPDETAYNEPSHQDLRCLTISLPALHINVYPVDSLLIIVKKTQKTQKKKTDD